MQLDADLWAGVNQDLTVTSAGVCDSWTAGGIAHDGSWGRLDSTTAGWVRTGTGVHTCITKNRLYCFEM